MELAYAKLEQEAERLSRFLEVRPGNQAIIDLINSRKSVAPKRLIEPGPNAAEIGIMLQSACTAPDHGALRPWRAVLIPADRRAELAELFRAAKLEECPEASPEELDRASQKALNGPTLIAFLILPCKDHPDVPVEEQYVALGAALQNMLLIAHALGYGAMITSGTKMGSNALRRSFGRHPDERLVAFVTVGTPPHCMRTRSTIDMARHVSEWDGALA